MSIEAMKQALDALESTHVHPLNDAQQYQKEVDAMEALVNAIEQAEKQKPMLIPNGFELVAVKGFDDLMYWLDRCDRKRHLENCPDLIEPYEAFDYIPIHIPINATQQPQREWVGLTPDDRREIFIKHDLRLVSEQVAGVIIDIEAKIKEQNT